MINSKVLMYLGGGLFSLAALYITMSGDSFSERKFIPLANKSSLEDASLSDCLSKSKACVSSISNSSGNTLQTACLHANAVISMDVEYCEAIAPSQARKHCVSEVSYSEVALEWGAGPSYSLDVKDQCYADLAFYSRDSKHCSAVVHPDEKKVCEQFAEKTILWPNESVAEMVNSSLGGVTSKYMTLFGVLDKKDKAVAMRQCDLIPDGLCVDAHDVGQLKDKCIAAVATQYADLSLCQTIERDKASCSDKRLTYSKHNCFADNIHLEGGSTSLCSQITHPDIRKTCYGRIETINSN